MPLTVTRQEAADRFPELIDLAADGPQVVIEENGAILAAIVPHRKHAEFLAAHSDHPADHPADHDEE